MKMIVYISHDRRREDIVKVYEYSEENLAKVEKLYFWHFRGKWMTDEEKLEYMKQYRKSKE